MSSLKLNCLGESKFVQENSNLDDKCQDTPDDMTGETLIKLIKLPAPVPGGLSVILRPILICSRLTQMETLRYNEVLLASCQEKELTLIQHRVSTSPQNNSQFLLSVILLLMLLLHEEASILSPPSCLINRSVT